MTSRSDQQRSPLIVHHWRERQDDHRAVNVVAIAPTRWLVLSCEEDGATTGLVRIPLAMAGAMADAMRDIAGKAVKDSEGKDTP